MISTQDLSIQKLKKSCHYTQHTKDGTGVEQEKNKEKTEKAHPSEGQSQHNTGDLCLPGGYSHATQSQAGRQVAADKSLPSCGTSSAHWPDCFGTEYQSPFCTSTTENNRSKVKIIKHTTLFMQCIYQTSL